MREHQYLMKVLVLPQGSLEPQSQPSTQLSSQPSAGGDESPSPTSCAPKRKPTRPPSKVWTHFTKVIDDAKNPKARCNYCGVSYACGSKKNGTSNLLTHLSIQCKKFTNRDEKRQKTLVFEAKKHGEDGGLVAKTYNAELVKENIARMLVMDELPFSFVDRQGFKDLMRLVEPRFVVPSRRTVTRDCFNLYMKEKKRLKEYFIGKKLRVCLTTDTWTSCQNLNYMVLTSHYVDENWCLQKKILNYCVVPNHRGETLGKGIEQCLLEWGIENIFTVTVDNAASNDVAISYLVGSVCDWGGAILQGMHMHIRCCAHILNLVVMDGLKEHGGVITKIRNVVRFVRGSGARMLKLKSCAEQAKITSKKTACLDVPTRWNSTYIMLEAAIQYQKAFERMETHDVAYVKEFCGSSGSKSPSSDDWDNARYFVKFLKIFYDATLRFSGTLHVTSNIFLEQICFIGNQLDVWGASTDMRMSIMAQTMKIKFNKYWGSVEKINPLLIVAVLLDPRYKEAYVNICLETLSNGDVEEAQKQTKKIIGILNKMYEEYCLVYSHLTSHCSTSSQNQDDMEIDGGDVDAYKMFQTRAKMRLRAVDNKEPKTEVDKYLMEACEDMDTQNFDILNWWKINSSRYKILSLIARDVLAVPISTVASESAFSTGGRIIDSFRNTLNPKTVQALICTQNWFRNQPSSELSETPEEVESIAEEILVGIEDLTIE
uniref:BED-type domain-containing protein n=1 Tax=Cannabis sativa TaxID=3483 RepID=A0A803PEN4_CANSA